MYVLNGVKPPRSKFDPAFREQGGSEGQGSSASDASGFEQASEHERTELAVGAAGMGNTAAQPRQKHVENPIETQVRDDQPEPQKPRHRVGPDTLEALFYGQWQHEAFTSFMSHLEARQKLAKLEGKGVPFEWGSVQGLVEPGGVPKGFGYCRYKLLVDGVRILLVNREAGNKDRPLIQVEVGSIKCMEMGSVKAVAEYVRNVVVGLGFTVAKCCPSRVDYACDVVGFDLETWCRGLWDGKYVTRLADEDFRRKRRRCTGAAFGGDNVMLRVYDKRLELMGKGGHEALRKAAILQERMAWDGKENLTRFEWQVRRESMRQEFGIDTMEDLVAKEHDMLRRLCVERFRSTREVPDIENRNGHRCKACGTWARITELFAGIESSGGRAEKPVKVSAISAERLRKMAAGCLFRAMASDGVRTVPAFIRAVGEFLMQEYNVPKKLIEETWAFGAKFGEVVPRGDAWVPSGAAA